MCGRFTQFYSWAELQEFYQLLNTAFPNFAPSWNVAPTQIIGTILPQGSGAGGLIYQPMRWGLVPFWAKDIAIGNKLINARSETVAEKPVFRSAFKERRCVIPVSGFFEWQKSGRAKIPHFIRSVTGEPLSFAGLWENWRAPDGQELMSCTILTTDANAVLAPVHHRMPVILGRGEVEPWLEKGGNELFRPCPSQWLTSWPVSSRVNSPANNGPDLIDAAPKEDLFA